MGPTRIPCSTAATPSGSDVAAVMNESSGPKPERGRRDAALDQSQRGSGVVDTEQEWQEYERGRGHSPLEHRHLQDQAADPQVPPLWPSGSHWCPSKRHRAPPDPRRARPSGRAPAPYRDPSDERRHGEACRCGHDPESRAARPGCPGAASARARPRLRLVSSSKPCSQTSTLSPEP
jgi:hypothetical protein